MIYQVKLLFVLGFLTLNVVLESQNPYAVSSKSEVKPPPEVKKSAFAQKFKYINPADWKPGMTFIVPPPQSGLVTDLHLRRYNDVGGRNIDRQKFMWQKFTLEKIVQRPGIHNDWTSIVFRNDTSLYEFLYKFGGIDDLRKDKEPPGILGLVWLDEIDQAKKELEGKYVYILTNKWMEDVDDGIDIPQTGEQFVKVKIIAIGCGQEDEPLKIVFETPSGGKAHKTVFLSGTNRYNSIMNGDHFDKVFSLTDPKLKYPNINATNWRLIQQSKVKIGMTESECILAWGLPDDINSNVSTYGAAEQWVYENGGYLYFKGKKLVHIQN